MMYVCSLFTFDAFVIMMSSCLYFLFIILALSIGLKSIHYQRQLFKL